MAVVKSVLAGIVGYIVSDQLISALVTGTSTADTLITTVVPIALGAGVVWGAMKVFGGK